MTESPIRDHATARRALACAIDTSGAGLASTTSRKFPGVMISAIIRFTLLNAAMAIVRSAVDPTVAPTKPGGLTPTMVTGAPLTSSVSPTILGLRRN